MIRIAAAIALISASLWAIADVEQRISATTEKIKTFDKRYEQLNAKMAATAREILEQKSVVLTHEKELDTLESELVAKETDYANNKTELETLENSQKGLNKTQSEIEQHLVFAIARNAALVLLLEDPRAISADALMMQEALKNLQKQSKEEIASLNSDYHETILQIEALHKRSEALRASIAIIDEKRKNVAAIKTKNEQDLASLTKHKKAYARQIDTLLKQQENMKKALSELNIIKVEELKQLEQERLAQLEKERRAKEEAARKAAAAKKEPIPDKQSVALDDTDLPEIKKQSIYHNVKTRNYRGSKTIAPLDGYKLVKEFGPYTDPIYNIKIFNESVSLKPSQNGAKVKNVLNGKVILAKETPLLDNVVIIEHSDGLHTIYAHLDQIAPTVKKGQKIRKGYVIGRVQDELMFEVTQKNYHINPMQLIN